MRDFAADRKLIEQATPGPWSVSLTGFGIEVAGRCDVVDCPVYGLVAEAMPTEDEDDDGRVWTCRGNREANAALIAACPTGWLAALDRIAELEAENARLKYDNETLWVVALNEPPPSR